MVCSKCGGKVKVDMVVKNEDKNEIYRKRKCKNCGRYFYTMEFESHFDDRFRKAFIKWRKINIGKEVCDE